MNKKFFPECTENFEVESLGVELNVRPVMTFNDLTDAEKAEFFGEFDSRGNYTLDLVFSMEDAIELTL